MGRRSPVKVGLALALICAITNGQAEESCRSGCRGAQNTFKYNEGTTYKYSFDSKIEVSLSSAEGQKSTTEVKATVLLTQQPQCNQVLRLQNVQVLTGDGKKHQIPDADKPIRLNFQDGRLEDSICITPGDSQNSLNIKRAIASIFQANLKNGHETDVFGLCPTEVSQHKEGSILVVQKTRDLNRCAYRENIKQDFLATAFNLDSEIRSSPILNGDYEAKLRIKNGVLDQATVLEQYLYVPFSAGANGAKTSVETTLKYVGTTKDNAQTKCSQPRSIIFEDPHPVNSPTTNVNTILTAVKQVAKTVGPSVGENTAKEFANLVRILRVSKKDDLLAVYSQVNAGVGGGDKTTAKKLFLDALLRAGNGDNIEVAIELLKNRELSPIEQNLVFLGLSTVRHPTEGSLSSAVALLNLPNIPRVAYLGIGNLAGRFCRQHSCAKVEAVNKLTQKLLQKLGNGKPGNRQQENEIVYVLKALANIRQLSDAVVAKITAIAQDKKTPNRLRVTALETYLADACKDKLRDSALTILKDIQQDSEVRIKAYLALAQCPNNKVGNAVKSLLENEPSYQVGGFIVTHIRNLRASANPDKEAAKQHLGLINVPKRFPLDPRKYSSNAELSYTFDTLGLSNSLESNLIYSQNSFLPRSTSLNLTAQVFGHSFNFLEIATRQENLDRLLEHYLGPQGLLRSNSAQELWDNKSENAKKILTNLREKLQKTLRAKRDLFKADIDSIGKQVQIKTNELNNDLDLDFSLSAFGSEVLFLNLNDDINKYTPEAVVDKIVGKLSEGLDKLKQFEETVRSNLLFLDVELAYPTSAGLPLRLGVEGSSNLQVKASGSVDVRSLIKQEGTLKLSLVPSANIEVAGRLTVDALVVESGLKVVSTLYTSTGGDLTVQFLPNGVDVKFGLPLPKQNVLSASHDIVFHTREWGAPEVNTPLKFAQNKDFSICFDQLSPFVGLTFCSEYTGPNLQGQKVPVLPFPLSGDGKVAVYIEREDLKEFHFRHLWYSSQEKLGVEETLEVIAANGQKKVQLALEGFWAPEKVLKAILSSPVINALAEGRITTTDQEKSISAKFVQDNNEYSAKLGVQIQGNAAKAIYKPIIQYKTPEASGLQVPPYHVEGQVVVENKGPGTSTYTLDNVRLVIPNQRTFNINGKLGTEPETVFADVTASDGKNSASFNGKLRVNPKLVQYNAQVKNSLNPNANVHVKGEVSRSGEELKNNFELAHGGDFSNKKNIFSLENTLKYRNKGPQDYLLDTKNKVSYPGAGLGAAVKFEIKPKALAYEVDVQYGNIKFGSELDWEHNQKRDGTDFELKVGAWGLNNRASLKSKRQVTGEVSQIENLLEVNGKRFEVNGKVRHHVRPQDVDVGANLIVKVPTNSNPITLDVVFKLNSNELDVSQKVSSAGTVFVDVFLKANRGGNANGNLKVNLKDQLVINGQVKANKGSGNAEIVIEIPQASRTTKLDSTFTVHEPNYNVLVNIYPIFNKDKSKKITLSTQTSATLTSLDSKNTIDVFGDKLEANVKGTRQGDFRNGVINGEAEVTLPNQYYLAAKVNRDVKTVNSVINGKTHASVESRPNKNQAGNKITLGAVVRNTNVQEKILDLEYQLNAERSNGQNVNIDLGIKRQPSTLTITNKISGSILASPLETSLTGTRKDQVVSFEAKSSYSPLGQVALLGKSDCNEKAGSVSGELGLEVSSPSQALKTLKVALAGSAKKSDTLSLTGKSSVYADSPKGVIADFSSDALLKVSDKEGSVKAVVKSNKIDPITITAGFARNEDEASKQFQTNLGANFGKNQNIKSDLQLIRLPKHEYKVLWSLETPSDKLKTTVLKVHGKRTEDNSRHQSDVTLTTNGKTWTANSDILLTSSAPSADLKLKSPEGKLRQILLKVNNLSDRQLGAQLKVINQEADFLLEGTIDANVQTADDFHVKITANSPYLKLDKYVVEAQNKPAKTGRRIQVTAKSANKNVVTGSTSYTAREEQGKLIIEGSGSFKIKEDTKSVNFKYIRQNLSQTKNGETGIEVSFNGGLGSKAVDAEFKVSNKQFRILGSYCEEKKQCAHVEVDAKTSSNDAKEFNQEVEVAVDLRKLGLSHEFGLKAVTTRKDLEVDHSVDVHFQSQENSKYKYSQYLRNKEAGLSLTTPKRIVALEANLKSPPGVLKNGGRVNGEVAFWLDKKNQPNQKSSLSASLDLDPKAKSWGGEARLANPGLKRPLVVTFQNKLEGSSLSGVYTIDVFNTQDQKVVVSFKTEVTELKDKKLSGRDFVEVKSAGLGIEISLENYATASIADKELRLGSKLKYHVANSKSDSFATFEASTKSAKAAIRVLNLDLFKLESQLQLSNSLQVVDTEVSCYGHKPLVSHLEVKDLNRLSYTLARKDNPNDKLIINSGLKLGEIADFRAEVVKGGSKQELGHATVYLDDARFLKSDYNVQSKNLENLVLVPLKNAVKQEGEELKRLSDKFVKEAGQELKNLQEIVGKAAPNLTPLRQYYINELTKIKEEILADKNIRDLSEFLHSILAAFSQSFGEVFKQFSAFVESIVNSFAASFSSVLEVIQNELIPKLKDISDKILQALVGAIDTATDIVLTIGAKLAQIAEKYRPELQQLATVFGEASQDVFRALIKVYEAVRSVALEQWKRVVDEVKALPAFEQLKTEYERIVQHGLVTREDLTNGAKDLFHTFKDLAPTEELKAWIQALSDYVLAKLTNQKVDDRAAIDKILQTGVAAVQAIITIDTDKLTSPDLQNLQLSLPAALLRKLPRLAGGRLSVLSYLLREEVVVPAEFLASLINHPRNLIPPFPLYGIVAQGQHIFTFDGKHLTFPGTCSYLLARDAVDGNFSVIGTYSNGLLTAISLTQGPDTLTLKTGGQVLLNNAATELPTRKPNIAAFRDPEKIVLISSYGVQVVCGPQLVVCGILTSGFYHGKLRGLLGNGNNEPYDDFVLPGGKIVTSDSDFGNAYKVGSGCANVKAVSHDHHSSSPVCAKLFGWESSLRFCYPFVNVDNFKTACEHGLSQGVKNTEKAIAAAYVAACARHGIPLRVPSDLVQCFNGDKPTNLGDQFSVKTPAKAADIVVLIDTNKNNEQIYKEYIQPLIQQLTTELQGKGVNDVEFHIIAYGGENQWPSHITNGGKLTFKGKSPNLRFAETPQEERLLTGCPQVDAIIELVTNLGADAKLALGLDLQARTYNEGFQYPFRANAVKSIIAVTGSPCQVGQFYPLQLLRTLLYRSKEINLNLITPISRDGAKAEAKNIVGFNGKSVFALGQTKNKLKSFSDLSKELTYNDYCIDFTVQNDGNVFVSDHILLQPKASRKQFVQATSHGIVEQLLGTEKGYDCECKYISGYSAANVCKVVAIKEKVQAKKAGTKS